MIRLNYLIILFAILLIAVYSGWLLTTFKPGPLAGEPLNSHKPDYFFEQVKTTLLDAKGKPRYRLTANRVEHHPDDDSVTLLHPHVRVYSQKHLDTLPWEIDAEKGRIIERGKIIHLLGAVSIERAAGVANAASKMETRDLTIEPDKSYAVTRAKVRIRHGEHRLRGTGMKMYFDQGRFEILAKGTGTYVAPH